MRFEIRSIIPVVVNDWVGPPPPRRVGIHLRMLGPAASRVRAVRVVVESASDDFGTVLTQISAPGSMHWSPGFGTPAQLLDHSLTFFFSGLSRKAAAIHSVVCNVSIMIPDLDPGATLTIHDVRSKIGKTIQERILDDAGVTLSLQFANGLDMMMPRLPGDDIMVRVIDPTGHLIDFEFQSKEGEPLVYDRSGFAHSLNQDGQRFDAYKITPELPEDAHLVCWLATAKSQVAISVTFSDIPLPDASPRSR